MLSATETRTGEPLSWNCADQFVQAHLIASPVGSDAALAAGVYREHRDQPDDLLF